MDYGQGQAGQAQVLSASPPSKQQRTIHDGITESQGLVAELHGAINSLEERLRSVLTSAPPAPGTASENRPVSDNALDRIDMTSVGIRAALQRIHALMLRLQL